MQFPDGSPAPQKAVRSGQTVTPLERRCVMPSTSKDVPPYPPRQTVQTTAMYPAKRKPVQVKECWTFSNIHPKIKGKQSAIQSAGRSVRTKVKTAERPERAAVKAAGRAASMCKRLQRTKQAVHTTDAAVKRTAESIGTTLKAIGIALRELMSVAVAGGGIAIIVVLIICLIGFLLAGPLGMFLSGELSSDPTISDAIVQINGEFSVRIEQIKEENAYDSLDLDNAGVSAALSNWKNVLAVYVVRITTDNINPDEVFTLTPEKQAVLRDTFWGMNMITAETQSVSGNITLRITATIKDALEMADEHDFDTEQRKLLEELLFLAYQEMFENLTGNYRYRNITLTAEQIQQIVDNLPAGLSTERKQVILTAYQMLGKVNYFWGGKSLVLGWNSRWGTPKDTHVGIVCGFDERGNVQIIYCASGANNVVVTGKGGFCLRR